MINHHSFGTPYLNKSRLIRVYVPPGYEENNRHYPVIYMHDGQNLFNRSSSYAEPWDLIPLMNQMVQKQNRIIVGIDNLGKDRIREYSTLKKGKIKGLGDKYLNLVVHQIKPFIDREYRTLLASEHTWMVGSSMGGLITFHAGLKYGHIFGKIGILSPSFWYNQEIFNQEISISLANTKFYLSGSKKESPQMEVYLRRAYIFLKRHGVEDHQIKVFIRAKGNHNEEFWAKEFMNLYELFTSESTLKTVI